MSLPPPVLESIKLFRSQLARFPAFDSFIVIARVEDEGEEDIRARPPVPQVWHTGYTVGSTLHRGLRVLVTSREGHLLRNTDLYVR